MPVSSDNFKRTRSLLQDKNEQVVDINYLWKKKSIVKGSQAENDTYSRIYVSASNVERAPEEGCMKKIKLERSLKLRKEDLRSRDYNIISNVDDPERNWLESFGDQKVGIYDHFVPKIKKIHDEKSIISNRVTSEDIMN